jgi:hypothetical protein
VKDPARTYCCQTVWPDPPGHVRAEAVAFWLRESALSEGRACERAPQLVAVCRDAAGNLAAVSTALPTLVPRLGLRCFFFRAFVGRAHRTRGLRPSRLIQQLLLHSYEALNRRFQQGRDPDVVGLYLEIENARIVRHRRELVWSDLGANIIFVGVLPGGRQARVWYFDGAKLPG